eukprot:CAMPEP_0173433126 /NCGR_PEP_ID=MMETSP1357-20121228/10684_1 /TAXON_ID=77926 /ORGANISM="Hemiselmis rufescens, Strain PCC563" /LENGTH=364 /DNA_ID=CAMNT_0014397807 /DNA_START=36 /DNA_END=1130 /DNA_ORIENTATION=+
MAEKEAGRGAGTAEVGGGGMEERAGNRGMHQSEMAGLASSSAGAGGTAHRTPPEGAALKLLYDEEGNEWLNVSMAEGEKEDAKQFGSCCWGSSKAGGLPAAAAPHWTVRPFILWGYRDCMSWRQCCRSLFTLHNETGNVWTHVFGLLVFLVLQAYELLREDKTLHHRVVASGYIMATNFCMVSSAIFHLMTPHSKQVYEQCLRFDMTGIALVIIASFLVGLHYGYWCHPFLGKVYFTIVGVLSGIAIAWPHMPKLLHNFNLSVAFFASFVAFALVPLFHWVSVVGGLSSEQATLFFWKLIATFGLYALGFLFYGAQLPERLYSGKFDIVGHSHQLWHIAVLLGALEFYSAMQAYAAYRETHMCT